MRNDNRGDLTSGSIWAKLLWYFLPIAAGTIFQQLYNAVDGIVVSKFVGTEALAAVGGSAANISNTLVNFFVSVAAGGTVIIAQHYGAKNDEEVSRATHTAVTFATLAGIAIGILGILLSPTLLVWMDTPVETIPDATQYLRIVFLGAVFTLLFNMGSGILRAVGDSKRPFYYLMGCCGLNIVLDLTFVVAFHWDVAGVAIATIISQFVSAFLVLRRLMTTTESYRVQLKKIRIHRHSLVRLLRIGVPMGLQSLMYSITNVLIQVGINSLSTVVVASWALSGKLDGFYWGLVNAAGTAVCNFVGQNYGAGETERVQKSVKISFALFMGMTALLCSILLGFGHSLLHLFTDDMETLETTWKVITYFVPYYPIWTVIEIFSGALRGEGNTAKPFVITAIGICAVRITWVYSIFPAHHTLLCMSLCYPVSWAVTAIAIAAYYVYTRKKGTKCLTGNNGRI